MDLYMPSPVGREMGSLVVGIDTSGSIDDKVLTRFISEIVGICEAVHPETLHLIECDDTIQNHEVYTQDDLHRVAAKQDVKGYGGTDMPLIIKYVQKNNIKPEAIIILTDGLTPWPTSIPCPVLWAITTTVVAPNGVTIHIK